MGSVLAAVSVALLSDAHCPVSFNLGVTRSGAFLPFARSRHGGVCDDRSDLDLFSDRHASARIRAWMAKSGLWIPSAARQPGQHLTLWACPLAYYCRVFFGARAEYLAVVARTFSPIWNGDSRGHMAASPGRCCYRNWHIVRGNLAE